MFLFCKLFMHDYAFKMNLTRAVISPVAFKSIFTSAVVRSFGVVTNGIQMTVVFKRAFVNVWRRNENGK